MEASTTTSGASPVTSRLLDLLLSGHVSWLAIPIMSQASEPFRTNEQREYNSTVYLKEYQAPQTLRVSLELVVRDLGTVVVNNVIVGLVSPSRRNFSETVRVPDGRVVDKRSFHRGSVNFTAPTPREALRFLESAPVPRYVTLNVTFAQGTNRLAIYVHCRGNNPAVLVSATSIPAVGGGELLFTSDADWRLAVAGSGPRTLINPSIVA